VSRGPRSLRAQDESLPIAEKRGLVMRYQHRSGNVCDFSIMSPGLVSFVCAMRLIMISSTPEDILHDYAKVIGQLRFIASSPAISRELWLRTPRGAWRFFRILDSTNIELDRDGMPLSNTGPVKNSSAAAGAGPVKKPGANGQNGKKILPASLPLAGKKTEQKNDPAEPGSGHAGENVVVSPSAINPEPENDPAMVSKPAGPMPENTDKSGTVPAQLTVPENHPANPEETDTSQFPGINLELIRRFMRWRKERQKTDPGSG
jgi:hypothetical protein